VQHDALTWRYRTKKFAFAADTRAYAEPAVANRNHYSYSVRSCIGHDANYRSPVWQKRPRPRYAPLSPRTDKMQQGSKKSKITQAHAAVAERRQPLWRIGLRVIE
jgi:hypothetical protein